MISLQLGCLGIIALIAMLYYSAKRKHGYFHNLFSSLLGLAAVYIGINIATVYVLEASHKVHPVLLKTVFFLYYANLVTLIYVTFLYVVSMVKENYQESQIKGYRWCIPACAAVFCLIVLPFEVKPFPGGAYVFSPAVVVTYLAIIFYILVLLCLFIRYWKLINQKKRQIIFVVYLVMASCILSQTFHHMAAISAFAVTLLVAGLYLSEESPDVKLIQQLQAEKARADAANNAKSAFLANMSHEMRTPINAIIGMDEMILRESREDETREHAIDIKNAAQILHSLINDTLDLSKIESGKMEIVPVEYQLSSLINDLVNMTSVRADAKNLKLIVEVDPELPSAYFGDDVRIRQVLTNILTNAVKYTSEGSVTLTVKRSLVQDGLAVLHFSVVDTGEGIREEDMPKLFAAFERIEEGRHRKEEGTGLGMSITTKLLELMGTRLQVESEYGKGSNFYFDLEQRILNPQPIGNFHENIRKMAKDYSYSVSFVAPDAKVLVVDDNEINRKVFIGLLKQTKVQVTEAASGKACLELVGQQHFDLIFLDHMMPDMDGIETLKYMREMPEEQNRCIGTPVIILTANAVTGVREEYLQMGFDEYLAKPIVPDKLEAMIQRMLPAGLVKGGQDTAGEPTGGGRNENAQNGGQEQAELPETEGVDWNYARLHLPGDDLIRSTAEEFRHRLEKEDALVEKLAADTDSQEGLKNYRIEVHALKSSAAMIGAMQLSALAALCERSAIDENRERIRLLTPLLLEQIGIYRDRFAPFARQQAGEKDISDRTEIMALLDMVETSMQQLDFDKADEAMASLREYRFEGESGELLGQLEGYVESLDAQAAEQTAKKLAGLL